MDLDFYVEEGLLGGHDVGFDKFDFLSTYLDMSEENQELCRSSLAELVSKHASPVSGLRIDGSASNIPDAVWAKTQLDALRIYQPGYGSNRLIKLLADQVNCLPEESFLRPYLRFLFMSAKPVQVKSVYGSFSNADIKWMQMTLKAKQCYRNSCLLAEVLDLTYIEGMCYNVIPFEHAFVRNSNGDYFDPTLELVVDTNITRHDYISQLELDINELRGYMLSSGVYGSYLKDSYYEKLHRL
jgi:hypothetical protein